MLSRRQSQEKLFLQEKPDENQHNSLSSTEPVLQETKSASEALLVDLDSSKPYRQRPSSFALGSQSVQLASAKHGLASSDSTSKVHQVNHASGLESSVSSLKIGASNNVTHTGRDVLDKNTNMGKLSSRWPPPRNTDNEGESLGRRRASAPKHLSCPPDMDLTKQDPEVMVVSMSPSYISVKDITQDNPSSPRVQSDLVKVSIPFQVQGQQNQQSEKPAQGSDLWSSSVSVCVPFQVNENGDSVTLLSSAGSALAAVGSTLAAKSLCAVGEDKVDGALKKEPPHSSPHPGRRKPHKGKC